MFEALDDISELAYVVDPETYEILYVNEAGKKSFHLEDLSGLKCYQVFQGLDAPCDFCAEKRLKEDEIYTWEHYNPVTGRYYLLKNGHIEWEGKPARVEAAFDCTEQAGEKRELKNALQAEKMLANCVRQLHNETNLEIGVNNMLSQVGTELLAARAYIFEVRDDKLINTYEWCAPGVAPQIDRLQDLEMSTIDRWRESFERDECVIVEDVEDIREASPEEYETLRMQGIKSLTVVPLERSGSLWGFLGVDDPSPERIHNITPLLFTLRYFLMATMMRLEGERKLVEMGFLDALTGLYNRNRYIEDIEKLRGAGGRLGVVYMDLNGLKEINDTKGHDEGDAALLWCAAELNKAFPQADIYRIGGDEFVVLQKDVPLDEFEKSADALRGGSEKAPYRIAAGTQWSADATDVERMIRLADEEMYEEKRSFYRAEGMDRRAARFAANDSLFEEYNTLTRSLRVSVSKHLLRDDFFLIWGNECFFDLIGYTSEEFEAYCHGDIKKYLENDAAEYERLKQTVMEAYQAGKQSYEMTIRVPRKDGMHIWIRLVGTYTDEIVDGAPVVFTIFTDVTDIVQMRIEQSTTYDNLPGFVVKLRISEDRPHLLYGNKRFMDFHGEQTPGSPSELLTDNVRLNQEVIAQHYEAMRAGQPVNFEVRAKNTHGQESYFQIYGGCVEKIQNDPVYLFVFIDITEMVNQRARLNEFAFVDPVTGGMNRTCFEIEAGGAMAAAPAGTYVLVSLDIQKFKVINDLFGIGSGDLTLRHVYEKIKAGLGQDEYVARLAADDFSLLLKADKNSRIEARISAFIEDINSYNNDLTNKYFLTFAVGVYPVDDPTLLMTQLQDRANVARNQVGDIADGKLFACRFYSNQDRIAMAREKEIENRMRDALKNKEFEVYLQPKQDVQSGKVGGAEALVRWNVPGEGLLPPGEFVPLFERNGFIVDLDLYVFDQTCAFLRKWLDHGLDPVPISVNMSRAHLADPRFLDHYEEIRSRYDIPCALLEIELTETLVFENPKLLSQIIDDIHRCNYHCSMDDFGSGYSSLNVLKNIRVDALKLDRAFFLSDKIDDPWEAAVIGVVVELAKKLGMKTVAEGVETKEQAAFLKEVGCDMIQGYLFSRPVPVAQFEALLFGAAIM